MERRKMLALIAAGAASMAGLTIADRQVSLAPRRSTEVAGEASAEPVAPTPADQSIEPAETASAGGTLVVFFSRAGENHPNLDLDVGNTAQVAGFIHERVGGDIFEIVPSRPYPVSYDETTDVAQRELDDQIYPAIVGELPDTARYDTVFLGHPNWWGEQPMIVQTFLRDRDLNHATIVPFVTHEGSSFGNSLTVLARRAPQARVLDGFSTRGASVHADPQGTRGEVGAWLDGLGL